MRGESLLSLLQFADGLFPAGAYAHSLGLEKYVDDGRVRDARGAQEFLHSHLRGGAGKIDAVAVVHSLRAARERDLALCLELDQILEATKFAAELRESSRQFGRQTLRILTALIDDPLTRSFFELSEQRRTPAHHAIVYGIAGAVQGWQPAEAARAFLYSSASAVTAAALRLIPLGQLQGQMILHSALSLINTLSDEALEKDICDMEAFAPGLEIAAMRHAYLEARLFRS